MSAEGLCQTCQQTWEWHQEHHVRHQFVALGEDPRLTLPPKPEALPTSTLKGDPVLRLALVKAGVLHESQIAEAEVWVREAAEQGAAVVVEDGEYKLLSIMEWIARSVAAQVRG